MGRIHWLNSGGNEVAGHGMLACKQQGTGCSPTSRRARDARLPVAGHGMLAYTWVAVEVVVVVVVVGVVVVSSSE